MTHRPYYHITDRGKQVLKSNPKHIDIKFLEQFPEFFTFREQVGTRRKPKEIETAEEEKTPEEILKDAYQEMRDGLAQELLNLVKKSTPSFFRDW